MSIITFVVGVEGVETLSAFYDRIEVWRSPDRDGPAPYTEITVAGNDDLPAVLDGAVAGPWNLNGLVLNVSCCGADPVPVSFSGTNPFSLQTVLGILAAAVSEFDQVGVSEVPADTGCVRLVSAMRGTGASLQVSGSAAVVLGLSTTKVNGKAKRISLAAPIDAYTVHDFDGSPSYWYKTRFSSTLSGAVGSFSEPYQGSPQVVLSDDKLALATVYLVDGSGAPIVGRRIIFVPTTAKSAQETVLYWSLPGVDRLVVTTNDQGYAEIKLRIGQTFKVFFEGSPYHRELTVPDESPFDLLTALSTAADPFSIVQSPPMPIRTS